MGSLKHISIYKFIIFIFIFSLFFTPITGKGKVTSNISKTGGIFAVEFRTPEGRIFANLPDDLTKGDQVSGKLTLWPEGKSVKDKAKNLAKLKKYNLELGGKTTPAGSEWAKWNIPDSKSLQVSLLNPKGKKVSTATIPVKNEPPSSGKSGSGCDGACIAGSMVSYYGKFDGDFSNTSVITNESNLIKWAESPRRVIVTTPKNLAGIIDISLTEGSFNSKCSVRNITIESIIGKETLLKGETTTLRVTIRGLEGLTEKIPLQLINRTSQIVSLKELEVFYIMPGKVQDGSFRFQRTLTGITPGKFHISVEIPEKQNPCEEILKQYNQIRAVFDKQDKDCKDLKKLVDKLRKKKQDAEAKRDKLKNDLGNTDKDLKDEKDKLNEAKKKLKKLIDSAIHVDGISSEPQPGLDNYVGLFGSDVGLYFSGSQRSIDVVCWFLREYRAKWKKLSREARDAKNKIKDLEKEKEKTEKELKDAEKELKDAEKELNEAEARLKECLKKKTGLDNQLNDLKDKYKKCLERIEQERICKGKIDEAADAINTAEEGSKTAESAINDTTEETQKLKNGSGKVDKKLDAAGSSLDEAEDLRKKAEETLEKAKRKYKEGDLEEAGKLAEEAKKLAEDAERKAKEAEFKTKEAQKEIDKAIKEELEAKKKKERLEKQKREQERREKEWWDRFLTESDPDPHDINGGKENLAIGLSDVMDKYILDQITTAGFGEKKNRCKDRCLIAVRNTFREQWSNLLENMAWDVFLETLSLPAMVTKLSAKIAFGVFKEMVSEMIEEDNVIPLWGKYTYEHPFDGFKHINVGKFKCEIESHLVYNKDTGYVMGMVFCNCCGKTTTLYIKYKVDENGRALKRPFPRIEFR